MWLGSYSVPSPWSILQRVLVHPTAQEKRKGYSTGTGVQASTSTGGPCLAARTHTFTNRPPPQAQHRLGVWGCGQKRLGEVWVSVSWSRMYCKMSISSMACICCCFCGPAPVSDGPTEGDTVGFLGNAGLAGIRGLGLVWGFGLGSDPRFRIWSRSSSTLGNQRERLWGIAISKKGARAWSITIPHRSIK